MNVSVTITKRIDGRCVCLTRGCIPMLKNLFVAAVVASLPMAASAVTINGSSQIDIGGTVDLDASAFNAAGNVVVSGPPFIQIATGDFSGLADLASLQHLSVATSTMTQQASTALTRLATSQALALTTQTVLWRSPLRQTVHLLCLSQQQRHQFQYLQVFSCSAQHLLVSVWLDVSAPNRRYELRLQRIGKPAAFSAAGFSFDAV